MREIITDTGGHLNSALIFRAVWHIVAIGLCCWYAAATGPDLGLLAFAGGMATGEGVQYAWRRGQDRKAAIPKPDPGVVALEAR